MNANLPVILGVNAVTQSANAFVQAANSDGATLDWVAVLQILTLILSIGTLAIVIFYGRHK